MQKMKSTKKTKSSSNLTGISEFKYIPSELCSQILANLPAKTVVRFRCVCKSWCSIIDNPDFVTQHRNLCKINSVNNKLLLVALERTGRGGRKGCLLTVRHANALRQTDHILKSSKTYYVVGSCNELLLIRGFNSLGEREPLMLWNPCIRKLLRIPLPPLSPFGVAYTFGFVPNSNDYKVVAMSSQQSLGTDVPNVGFAVYTLSNQQWSFRNDGLNMSYPYYKRMFSRLCIPQVGFFFQGATHWIGYDPNNEDDKPAYGSTHLVSLDFNLERFNFLELTFASDDRGAVRLLFRLRESLAVFCISSVKYSVWALKGDSRNGEWTPRFSGFSSSDGFDLFRHHTYLPLFYYESDDGGCFVYGKESYNISNGQVRELGKSMSRYVDMEVYMEGLVLCTGYGAEDLQSLAQEQQNATISNE